MLQPAYDLEKIRERMLKHFLYYPQSYRCYGRALKIHQDTFKDFIEGKKKPHPVTLARIVKFLDDNEKKEAE